jgi:RNase adaptor protein for sRNA GlmZ degradation
VTEAQRLADLALAGEGDIRRAAVVVDIREGAALAEFPQVYRRLKRRAGAKAEAEGYEP